MTATPLVSVVVPTRNRPELLRGALEACIAIPFQDLELVVCDNGDDDRSRAVVDELDDHRLRYVKTPQALSMPDSWEFAGENSRGSFVTFLCDDDAPVPQLIDRALAELKAADTQIVVWNFATYAHANWMVESSRYRVSLYGYGGDARTIASETTLRAMCNFESIPAPMMLNSLTSRAVLDQVREKAGRLFHPPAPDFAFALAALASTDRFSFIDQPLTLFGASAQSTGVTSLYGATDAINRFADEFAGADLLPDMPLKVLSGKNVIAQTLHDQLPRLGLPSEWLSSDGYFRANLEEFLIWRGNGRPVHRELDEWERVVRGEGRTELLRYKRRRLARAAGRSAVDRAGAARLLAAVRPAPPAAARELALSFHSPSISAAAAAVGTLVAATRWPEHPDGGAPVGRW